MKCDLMGFCWNVGCVFSRTFETEQREQFRGVDLALHPPSKPVEKREDALKPSSAAEYEMQSTHRVSLH